MSNWSVAFTLANHNKNTIGKTFLSRKAAQRVFTLGPIISWNTQYVFQVKNLMAPEGSDRQG